MKVRLYSDIHNEIRRVYDKFYYINNGPWVPIELPEDKETILILAGDVDSGKNIPAYLNLLAPRFKAVIHIAGNHEYYGSNIGSVNRKMKVGLADNVYQLNNETVTIDGVKFIGGTMWSPLNHPLAAFDVGRGMNDYKMIRHGPHDIPWKRKLTTVDTIKFHREWLDFAYKELHGYVGKTVVISHNTPWTPTDETPLSEGWNSSQEGFIFDMGPTHWMYGHDHSSTDRMFGQTRINSNCVGYYSEDTEYNDNVIEI